MIGACIAVELHDLQKLSRRPFIEMNSHKGLPLDVYSCGLGVVARLLAAGLIQIHMLGLRPVRLFV